MIGTIRHKWEVRTHLPPQLQFLKLFWLQIKFFKFHSVKIKIFEIKCFDEIKPWIVFITVICRFGIFENIGFKFGFYQIATVILPNFLKNRKCFKNVIFKWVSIITTA